MRLTYRAGRVLATIGDWVPAHGGAHPSNRAVALGAEIEDEGQASKLLKRLRAYGLIENVGEGRPAGAPNAWRLTTSGQDALQAIRKR
jgi:hypothetical protein